MIRPGQAFRKFRRVARLLRPHVAGEGRSLALGAALGIVLILMQLARPWPLKWMLDYLSGSHKSQPIVEWVSRAPLAGLLGMSALLVALAFGAALAHFAQVLVINGLGNRVLYRFRADLFAHLLRQSLAFHETHEVGELLTRIIFDTSRLRRGVNGFLLKIFQTLVLLLTSLGVLFWLHPGLALVLAAGGVLSALSMIRRGRRVAEASQRQRRKEGSLAGIVGSELFAIRDFKALGVSASAAQRKFEARNQKSLSQEQKVRRIAAGLALRVEIVVAITLALTLWIGTQAVLSGSISAGDLVLFFSYATALHGPLVVFADQTSRLGRTYACAERLAKLAEQEPEIVDAPDAIPVDTLRGELELMQAFAKSPRELRTSRKYALEDVTLHVPAGRRVAVMGANGAGKTALLKLILRLSDPASGVVRLDGRDLREYAIETVRRQCSVVFQDSVLAGLTVRDNITLGLDGVSQEQIEAAAEAARASIFISRLPKGYDTPVRRTGGLFSGGERQRLALARAFLRDGRLWLLDEPTTGVDAQGEAGIIDSLMQRTAGKTTLWVTHDVDLVRRLDWVIALKKGRVVFDGPTPAYLRQLEEREGAPSEQSTQAS